LKNAQSVWYSIEIYQSIRTTNNYFNLLKDWYWGSHGWGRKRFGVSANIRTEWVLFGDYFKTGRLVIHFYIYTYIFFLIAIVCAKKPCFLVNAFTSFLREGKKYEKCFYIRRNHFEPCKKHQYIHNCISI
jgi:hypothetical protein